MKKFKGLLRIVFGRTAWVFLFLIIQIGILFSCFHWLGNYLIFVYGGFTALSAIIVIYIINERVNPSFKLSWIVPVLVVPVFGALFFLFVQLQVGTKIIANRIRVLITETAPLLEQDQAVTKALETESQSAVNLAHYVEQHGGYPTYQNTKVTYFPSGEAKFAEMKDRLEQAKDFIFMEYFIIEDGVMWGSICEILERKAKAGVDVRVMYDGMCSIILLPYSYPKKLEAMGIKCKMFSPIKPALSTHQNNRDHRKIMVVDGHTAITGGVNLADEYINQKVKYGHWKDTAIMLEGDAVKSFTIMFLQMWNITEKEPEDYARYIKNVSIKEVGMPRDGFVIPYGDSPLDRENVGEYVYMDMLNQANTYVHIMTPYLILDNEMLTALTYAAKRGVETTIIMPHIPDKWTAYLVARSHYFELLEAGVQIYEYTPGFVHAKIFVSDDEKAVVGTINLDFRSLYLHFECAAYLYRNAVIADIETDFMNTLNKCQRITLEEYKNYPLIKRVVGRVLRLFAPLM